MNQRKKETSIGLDQNIAGSLAYMVGFVTGIILYLLEKENKYVRFHAAQSTIVFGGLFLAFIFSRFFLIIPLIGWFIASTVALMISIVAFILWFILILKAYHGEKYALPTIGKYADKYA